MCILEATSCSPQGACGWGCCFCMSSIRQACSGTSTESDGGGGSGSGSCNGPGLLAGRAHVSLPASHPIPSHHLHDRRSAWLGWPSWCTRCGTTLPPKEHRTTTFCCPRCTHLPRCWRTSCRFEPRRRQGQPLSRAGWRAAGSGDAAAAGRRCRACRGCRPSCSGEPGWRLLSDLTVLTVPS